MKLLSTSGITNPSIRAALLDLLGKPIEVCTALVNSTASYPLRHGPQLAWNFIAGEQPMTPMADSLEVRRRPRAHRAAQHRANRPGFPRSKKPTSFS